MPLKTTSSMRRSLRSEQRGRHPDHFNRVAWLDDRLLDDLRDPSAAADDRFRQSRAPLLQRVARHADVGDLDQAVADSEAVAPFQRRQIDAAGREIFAEGAV